MHDRHKNRLQYFQEQEYTTLHYVIPYLSDYINISPKTKVLEIGCGEAGNLKPFLDIGCKCVGVDLSESKIENGKHYFNDHIYKANLSLLCKDIYLINPSENFTFDLIIMRDTLEHIPNQNKFLGLLKSFLTPKGKIFNAFPPWQMPFGGHQQMCSNKLLSVLPYFHLLPKKIYTGILKLGGESQEKINSFIEIKDTGISIETYKKILSTNSYKIEKETNYLVNPNYEIKFKLKTKKLLPLFNLPYIRNFYTTAHYSIISLN